MDNKNSTIAKLPEFSNIDDAKQKLTEDKNFKDDINKSVDNSKKEERPEDTLCKILKESKAVNNEIHSIINLYLKTENFKNEIYSIIKNKLEKNVDWRNVIKEISGEKFKSIMTTMFFWIAVVTASSMIPQILKSVYKHFFG